MFHPSTERELCMNPTLIFLDIDDVLCLSSPYGGFDALAAVKRRHVNSAAVYRELFVATARAALKRVHDEMAGALRYVISSTWRESFSREQLDAVFRQGGLDFVADRLHEGELWRTPAKFGRSRRVDEIAHWLQRHHQGERFVIIDDTCSGASLMPALGTSPEGSSHPFTGRVVLCQECVGLTDEHVQPIVEALRRELP